MSIRLPSDMLTPSPDAGPAKPETQPLTPFAAGPGGFLTEEEAAPPSRRLGGAGVLILVVLGAAGLLAGMRKLGMGPRLTLADIRIDYPLEEKNSRPDINHAALLESLASGTQVRRVPLDLVQTNPFTWRSLLPREAPTTPDDGVLSRTEAAERRRLIAEAANRLVLNSIIEGRVPVARISGELVRAGDRIGEYLTVESISGRSVVLVAGEQRFTLTLGEAKNHSAPGPLRSRGR